MNQYALDLMLNYGLLAIFLLILVENIFPPIPSEVILLFGGFLTLVTGIPVISAIAVATAGSVLGAILLYQLGKLLGNERMSRFFQGRAGKILGLKPQDYQKTIRWFEEKGNIAILLCRFVPLLRSLISIPAGLAHMNLPIFLVLTTLGSAIWNTVLILLGRAAGEGWQKYQGFFRTYSYVFTLLLCLGVAFLLFKIHRRKRERLKEEDSSEE